MRPRRIWRSGARISGCISTVWRRTIIRRTHAITKWSCGCGAGVFTAPIALQLLCELFDKHGNLDNLQSFVSDNAQSIYGICPEFKEVVLEKKPFTVPAKYGDVVPMYAGETIAWSIEDVL